MKVSPLTITSDYNLDSTREHLILVKPNTEGK